VAETADEQPAAATSPADVYGDFRARFGRFTRLRNTLLRRRVRAHLVSGIEFEMFSFIIAPLTGLIVVVPLVAGALLLAFELLLIYKLLAATRSYQRHLERASENAMQQRHVGDRLEAGLGVQL
jgi:hypothetical protein